MTRDEILLKLARRALWTAFVFNDHNFQDTDPKRLALVDASLCGIDTFDDANRFLNGEETPDA
jgi:hypothetical protein